jgi:hypothetical protein
MNILGSTNLPAAIVSPQCHGRDPGCCTDTGLPLNAYGLQRERIV